LLEFTDWMFILLIIAVVMYGVVAIVKVSTRYSENIERMKNGYPLRDGTRPSGYIEPDCTNDVSYQSGSQQVTERY